MGAFLCLVLTAPSLQAEDSPTILERFTGTWIASGNSFGDDVEVKMTWSKILSGQFYRIDYQINMMNNFSGVGHYKATKERTTSGYWADNSGDLHPLSVEFKDNAIVTIWGVAGKKQGRTEYRLVNKDQATVTDWLLTAGIWNKFNHGEFVRTPVED
ncbi:MAG: hypothetical protein ABJN65_16065 [Parasphingorhabdus sp.]